MWWIHRAFQRDAGFGKAAEQRQWNPACYTPCAAEKKTRKQNNLLLLVFPRCKGEEVENNFYLLNFLCLHWFHPSPLGTSESGISWFWWDFVGICMALNFFNKDDVGLRERYTLGIVSPVSHDMYVPLSKEGLEVITRWCFVYTERGSKWERLQVTDEHLNRTMSSCIKYTILFSEDFIQEEIMHCFDNGEIHTRIRLSRWTAAASSALKHSPPLPNIFPFSGWEAHTLENEWLFLLPSENNASLLIRRCSFNESLVVHGQKKSMAVLDLFNGGGSIDAVCCCCQLCHDVGFHVEHISRGCTVTPLQVLIAIQCVLRNRSSQPLQAAVFSSKYRH